MLAPRGHRSGARLGGAASGTAVRPPGRPLGAARSRAEQVPDAVPEAAGRGLESAPNPVPGAAATVAAPDLQGADGLDQVFCWACSRSGRLSSGTGTAAWLGGAASGTAVRPPRRPLGAARSRAEQALEAASRGPESAPDPVVPDLQGDPQGGARYAYRECYCCQDHPDPEQARSHGVWVGIREQAIVVHISIDIMFDRCLSRY